MQVSIWQQWASNHSAAFTLMGKFSTPEEAQRVGSIFQEMLRAVATWKKQDYETKWQAYLAANHIEESTPDHVSAFNMIYGENTEATTFEQRLAAQYHIDDWVQTLDYAYDPATAPNAVLVVDRAVIVAEDLIDHYSWSGFWPFEELMRKYGSEQIAIYFEHGGTAKITLHCTTPDNRTATRLMEAVRPETHQIFGDMIVIEGLTFAGKPLLHASSPGHVTSEGLTITYTFDEWNYGRTFAALVDYLRAQGCTNLDYTFATDDLNEQ